MKNAAATYCLDVMRPCSECEGHGLLSVVSEEDPCERGEVECHRCEGAGQRETTLTFVNVLDYVRTCVKHGVTPDLDEADRAALSHEQHREGMSVDAAVGQLLHLTRACVQRRAS